MCEEHFPDAFREAAKLPVSRAREVIRTHLLEKHNVLLSDTQAARIFHWDAV
jgi:hypothetical protein